MQLRHGDGAVLVASVRAPAPVLGPFVVRLQCFDVGTGAAAAAPADVAVPGATLVPGAVVVLPGALAWPPGAPPGAVLLWRLSLLRNGNSAVLARSEYTLSNLDADGPARRPQNYSALGALRFDAARAVPLAANVSDVRWTPGVGGRGPRVTFAVTLAAPPAARAVAAAVEVTLHDPAVAVTAATGFVDDRVLPADVSDGFFSLAPGEAATVRVAATWPAGVDAGAPYVRVKGWNTPAHVVAIPL